MKVEQINGVDLDSCCNCVLHEMKVIPVDDPVDSLSVDRKNHGRAPKITSGWTFYRGLLI